MKKKSILPAILIALVILGALGAFALLRAKTSNSEAVRLYLPEGTTYEALCDSVHADASFHLYARMRGLDQHVRAGSYVVQPHMSTLSLVQKLYRGQQDPVRLTIGKFRTPQQLNDYLNGKLMRDDFNVTLDSFHLILPDTYEFYWTLTPEQFMQRMEKEYTRFWKKNDLKDFKDLKDPKDLVVLASIVEEETNNNSEKPLIASVYLNRLKKGMPLQADPTVKYAVGDFTLRRILNRHLATESPFNTYLHTGLPPAPICLPSKETLKAVVQAPKTDYLYFCASDKLDGTHRFAATLAEHNRNAAAYHTALNRRGIR